MRTLEGIDTLINHQLVNIFLNMLEDMRTLEGIDTFPYRTTQRSLYMQLEDMRTLEWENCKANPVYIYEE